MKKKIDVFEHMGEILNGVKNGVLITGKADGRVNSMTISWGMVGVEWGKPVFITFVRESRFTRSLLEKNGEFTVNIPLDDSAKKILGYCGAKSGRKQREVLSTECRKFIFRCKQRYTHCILRRNRRCICD